MAWRSRLRLVLGAAGLALAAAPSPAGPAAALAPPPDALAEALALPVASDLAGARDAPLFAWVETAAGVRNIWFAGRAGPARRLTAFTEDDGLELSDLVLSADGASLAFVRGGDSEFPDDRPPNAGSAPEPPGQHVFVVATQSGAPLAVGEGHSPAFAPDGRRRAYTRRGEIWLWDRTSGARRLAAAEGEVKRLIWSPDGTRLLFAVDRGDYSFVALLDLAGPRLHYVDPGLGFSVEPVFSPDGRSLAFIRYVEPPAGAAADSGPYWSIRIADAASGKAREVWAAPPGAGARYQEARGADLFWSADDRILFAWEGSGWLHAYAVDAAQGGAARDLTPGAFEVETFLPGADGRSLVYSANEGDPDRRHVWRRPLGGGAPVRVTSGSGIETSPTPGGSALAVIATDAARPAYAALADTGLAPLGRAVALPGFAAPEPVLLHSEDGVEVHAQLFRARGGGRHPALVYVHGGPHRQMLLGFNPSYYYSNAYILNQRFAAEGYHVLAVNYRSGTGYGLAFREAPDIARGGAAEYRDVLAAGRWLAARGDVDPKRIGIWGGSWGGYLAALALARDSGLFAAGVDFHGVHSMLRQVSSALSPAAQEAARRLQWESSPLGAIERWRSPVLLIHGDDDRNVDFSQSVLLARELTERHIPYRELVFPGERHSFLLHAHWLASFRAADAFFEERLKAPRR
jgi:dipeptidyl aminopeptidase/acylaminoacyl peptidase